MDKNIRWINQPIPPTAEELNEIMKAALEAGEQWVHFTMGSKRIQDALLILISFN